MKSVFQALYTKFAADTNFKNAVNSQFYPSFADQERATFPYAVYWLITDSSDWTFTEDIEVLTVQISIFDDENSPNRVLTAFEYLKTLFDDAILSVTGYSFVRMHRHDMNMIRDEVMGTWHVSVDYEIEIRK